MILVFYFGKVWKSDNPWKQRAILGPKTLRKWPKLFPHVPHIYVYIKFKICKKNWSKNTAAYITTHYPVSASFHGYSNVLPFSSSCSRLIAWYHPKIYLSFYQIGFGISLNSFCQQHVGRKGKTCLAAAVIYCLMYSIFLFIIIAIQIERVSLWGER